MPYILEDLVVNRVDLVDEGANSAAFITLCKRKEQVTNMGVNEILEKMKPEHASIIQAELDKLNGEISKAAADLKEAEDKMAEEDAKKLEKEDKEPEAEAPKEDDEDTLFKSLPQAARELLAKLKSQKETAEEAVRKAKETEAEAAAVAKASTLKALPVSQDKLVALVKSCTPEVLEMLTGINAAIEATVLKEVGGKDSIAGGSAWEQIENKAEEVAKAKGISKAKAITEVIESNPALYKEYLEGGAN